MKTVRRCTRCIMDDSSDPFITFDQNGYCNYCRDALAKKNTTYFPNEEGEKRIEILLREVKNAARKSGSEYDCLMGLSGGLDSSYLAYLGAAKWGLRIAAVHIDDGYDTEISKENIRKLCEKANINLIVIKPDSEQFNALTKAYMKAGVPNLAAPQDNTLMGFLLEYAKKHKIRYFFSGGNFALECILQRGNTWNAHDLTNLKDIHRRFGEQPIDKLKFTSQIQDLFNKMIGQVKIVEPLNYVDYNRDRAFAELKDFCGFEYYGRKHLENYLTAFIQLYWFPKKFGVDKRTSHLSSMIVSGQMTREQALKEYSLPIYEEDYMQKVKKLICEKLQMSESELEALVKAPGKQHNEYKTDQLYSFLRTMYQPVKALRKMIKGA